MELEAAIELMSRFIQTEEKHKDYDRTVDLASDYKAFITGCDIEKQLRQVIKREDDDMFAQRVSLTKSITPAVASSVRRPFNKVARNDRVKEKIQLEPEVRMKAVTDMIAGFYGAKRKKNKGLNYWMKTRFVDLQFSDPNAWIVLEWETPDDLTKVAQPRPFEVESRQAQNFHIVNDEVKWLYICQSITFFEGPVENKTSKDGFRYTLYDEDLTIVFEQVDKQYLTSSGYVLTGEQQLIDIKEVAYLVSVFRPKLGFPPVIRIGYNRDEETKARTFVNPWHPGLCFFEKMLTTVSELDLTIALHTFPQKLQYVQKCPGSGKANRCDRGYAKDGSTCTNCSGKGYIIHTTAQDAILLPMPESKEEMIDLNNILVYKSPPIDLIKFQNEYTLQLERQVHQAVYNSQVFVKNNYSGDQSQPPMDPTATATDYNMQSVYDTLEPFTEKFSEVWKDFVIMFSLIAGEIDIEKIELVHSFPADPKLKNSGLLMSERKIASESGAPTFIMDQIDDDLAAIVYQGDSTGLNTYKVKRRFFPFVGKTPDEISELMTSEFVPKEFKILYSNFEQIFKELYAADKKFFLKDEKQQAELVKAKIEEFIAKLEKDKPEFEIGNFENPAAGSEGEGGDDNPGDDEGDNANNDIEE